MDNELIKYQGRSIIAFNNRFPDEVQCRIYLSHYKWKDGFTCSKCGGNKCWEGSKPFTKVCKKCRHQESATSNTLFHKVKFDLRKALMIVHEMTTTTKHISAQALSAKYDIHYNTAWLFRQKVTKSMENNNLPLDGCIEILTSAIKPLADRKKSNERKRKKTAKVGVVIAIERNKYGINQAFACEKLKKVKQKKKDLLKNGLDLDAKFTYSSAKAGKMLMESEIKSQNLVQSLKHAELFNQRLQDWIRGIHHQVSARHLQGYLDEFCYRFNHRQERHLLFDLTIQSMVAHPPWFYHKT